MTLFYIPNPTQCLNLTTILITINKQQIMNLLREKSKWISVPYSKVWLKFLRIIFKNSSETLEMTRVSFSPTGTV